MKAFLVELLLVAVAGWFIATHLGNVGDLQKISFLSPLAGSKTPSPINNVQPIHVQQTKTLFVPYWTLDDKLQSETGFDQLIYFGVNADKNGLVTTDDGYKNLTRFLSFVPQNKKKLLAVRMINTDVNLQILNFPTIQKSVIDQTISLAKKDKLDGIALDFEISALGFDSVTNNITAFETSFAKETKKQHLIFAITVYGDSFYRSRPFDIYALARNADQILIMAYDLHKANGTDPGPNFPLQDTNGGYDLVTMVKDFVKQVPVEKITVIFGLYGYDWTVDDKNQSTQPAQALSDNKISQLFLNTCQFADCKVQRDVKSTETEISYTDAKEQKHHVWLEDITSAEKKTEYLQKQGITSTAYWAYGYY